MATVIKRQFRATPHRTASETWRLIMNVISSENSPAHAELAKVAGVLEQIIDSEAVKEAPIVVFGNGPRLRVYCLYDDDAITGEDADEKPLAFDATQNDWHISVPCLKEDLKWALQELKKRSDRIVGREAGESVEDEDKEVTRAAGSTVKVDTTSFLRA